jgi:Secretion system C-terminal sorting domain
MGIVSSILRINPYFYVFCFKILARKNLKLRKVFFASLIIGHVYAQEVAEMPIQICEKLDYNTFTISTEHFLPRGKPSAVATSKIEVSYTDFPTEAKTAFQAAVEVWQRVLVSRETIKIKASWEAISSTTLATSSANKVYRNFSSSAVQNVWYPAALAEAVAGKNINGEDHEITINVNKNISWSFLTDGTRQSFKYDLMTVVLHEIAHGLGFTSTMKISSTNGLQAEWGINGFPIIYDLFLQNQAGVVLTNTSVVGNPSADLKGLLTSNALFFKISNTAFREENPKLYAPSTYEEGGSISHLDESRFPKGTANAMMSPQIGAAEVNHFPGNVILAILNQIGWAVNYYEGSVITALPSPDYSEKFFVFPNPAENELSLFVPQNFENLGLTVKFFDNTGRLVASHQLQPNGSRKIEISSLAKGRYHALVLVNEKTYRFDWVK